MVAPAASAWQITEAQAGAYVESQTWKFARTMPHIPHWYVLLAWSTNPSMHLRVVHFIRQNGETRRFPNRPSGER